MSPCSDSHYQVTLIGLHWVKCLPLGRGLDRRLMKDNITDNPKWLDEWRLLQKVLSCYRRGQRHPHVGHGVLQSSRSLFSIISASSYSCNPELLTILHAGDKPFMPLFLVLLLLLCLYVTNHLPIFIGRTQRMLFWPFQDFYRHVISCSFPSHFLLLTFNSTFQSLPSFLLIYKGFESRQHVIVISASSLMMNI